MTVARCAAVVAALLMAPGQGALAHDTSAGGKAALESGAEVTLTVAAETGAAVPPVATVPLGARVRLIVTGAGEAELHLHGYDVIAGGGEGRAVLVFDAVHEGRFPVEAHVEDDLLGPHGKPVLFVEVRAP